MREPPAIDAFGGGGFRVAGVWREGSLLILADTPQSWRPADLRRPGTPTTSPTCSPRRAATVEFVLLGTGAAQSLPPRAIREALRAAGLGLEFMATEAAARTHNVLASRRPAFRHRPHRRLILP